MKWSKPLHYVAALAALIGLLALLGAWIVGIDGLIWGQNQEHLFNDAQALFLLSIASGIGTLIHLKEEGAK